jgi:3-deoxy-D-manno-octulosonic-acid transferase
VRLLRLGYEGAAQLARAGAALASFAPRVDSKVLRALRARSGIRDRYAEWGRAHRDLSRKLLWMHAPSVGEGLQARPVLDLVRQRHPDVQLAYTHFSPSAARFASGLNVDFRDYLPFDSLGDARAALDALRPTAIVFAKLDVWPTLGTLAHGRGVKLGLVSATLAEFSSRRSRIAAALLHDTYALLDSVGAIDNADAERLVDLGVSARNVTVTGDTRYDQVWQRAQRVDRAAKLLARLTANRPTIVAGSTWPADEAVLLPAMTNVLHAAAETRLIIAPHEPTAAHLEPIEHWARTAGYRLERLDSADDRTQIVLVDRVGVLGDLYALGSAAFVGGGFHDAGLHSVLEPAAFGIPVLFGPRHAMSRDAMLLLRHDAARAVSDVPSLTDALTTWLTNGDARRAAGANARAVVQAGLGAAERSLRIVETLLGLADSTA